MSSSPRQPLYIITGRNLYSLLNYTKETGKGLSEKIKRENKIGSFRSVASKEKLFEETRRLAKKVLK